MKRIEVRLSEEIFRALDAEGCYVMLSNSDTESLSEGYMVTYDIKSRLCRTGNKQQGRQKRPC